ncbi:MAG: hypothetical protein ACRC5A_15590, partial [Enterobacteriaceae bacterium]
DMMRSAQKPKKEDDLLKLAAEYYPGFFQLPQEKQREVLQNLAQLKSQPLQLPDYEDVSQTAPEAPDKALTLSPEKVAATLKQIPSMNEKALEALYQELRRNIKQAKAADKQKLADEFRGQLSTVNDELERREKAEKEKKQKAQKYERFGAGYLRPVSEGSTRTPAGSYPY